MIWDVIVFVKFDKRQVLDEALCITKYFPCTFPLQDLVGAVISEAEPNPPHSSWVQSCLFHSYLRIRGQVLSAFSAWREIIPEAVNIWNITLTASLQKAKIPSVDKSREKRGWEKFKSWPFSFDWKKLFLLLCQFRIWQPMTVKKRNRKCSKSLSFEDE